MLVWLLFACTGCAGSDPPPVDGLTQSWVQKVVEEPERFSKTVEGTRDGWVAIHRNDWYSALAEGNAPASRAVVELGRFYSILGSLSNRVWLTLGDALPKRARLPETSLYPLLFRFAADLAGDEAASTRWQTVAQNSPDGRVAEVARRWAHTRPPELPANDEIFSMRMGLHKALRNGTGDLATFRSVSAQPLLVEPLPNSTRDLYDPLVYETLQIAMGRMPHVTPGTLDAELFSGLLVEGSSQASLAELGAQLPDTDNADGCRDAARMADSRLDAWEAQLTATATGDGRALLHDLRLVDGVRSRLFVDLAAEALEKRPQCALALVSMAMDHEHGRQVGPVNSPTLYAVTASAWLRLGHIREAKDALQVLVPSFPEVVALDETIGDLAVLDGMGRIGDSREH